jgi:hypothetical protein
MPLYPQSVASQGAYPNSSFFRCVHLGLTFESIKEFGSVSNNVILMKVICNLNFKGFMADNIQSNWNIVQIVYMVVGIPLNL